MARDNAALRARLGKLGSFIASASFVLALSLAIAWPLWFLATKARRVFTLASFASIALVVVFLAARAALGRIRGDSRRRARRAALARGSRGGR
jgi:hypothetical protein